MRKIAVALFVGSLLAVASLGSAQPPEGPKEGPKGGFGKGGFGKGGKGGFGFGGFGGMTIGQILPPFLQTQLKLTDAQKKELEALQKDVDTKLDKILTDDQRKLMKQMKERRGRGGPGGFGGFPGGPGGAGGFPPKKDRDR